VVKLVFLCRRRPELTHDRYAELVLRDHVPLALRHHPTMQGYVVNIVEHVPADAPEIDSAAALTFATLADYRERLYDSAAGERIVREDVARFMGGADAYATTEHVQKAPPATAPGARTPGVKLIAPLTRRADMSHEAFVAHWLERHVPLALAHHPGLVGYVTNVVDARLDARAPELDGIAELHFASPAAFARGLFDSPEGERRVREDIARFIGRTFGYRVAEYVQRRPPDAAASARPAN
jgi:uncharacterized protein (TIGR02118 family)